MCYFNAHTQTREIKHRNVWTRSLTPYAMPLSITNNQHFIIDDSMTDIFKPLSDFINDVYKSFYDSVYD